VWVDRQGREQPLETPSRRYVYPRLSPDGTRVVLDMGGPPARNTWMWDLRRRSLERFSTDPMGNRIAIWSPDGRYIAFGSDRFGRTQLFQRPADRSREAERLLESDTLQMPISFAPDGRLLFSEDVLNHGRDIQLLWLDGSRRVVSLVHGPGSDATAEVSPDSRWLAYDSDESGQFEVYVRPFPDADRARWQISTEGGRQPLWSKDGRELFYRDFTGAVVSVPVTLGSTFSAETPRILLPGSRYIGGGRFMTGRTYDLSLDGRRFLMLKPNQSEDPSIVMVLNWTEELKRRVSQAR
jgi:serine/threonine-protein kinase